MNIVTLLSANATDVNASVTPTLEWNVCSWLIERLGVQGQATGGLIMLAGVLACMLISYLLGSINPAIIFSRTIYHEDIRSYGSGNAGTTNTLRTYGKGMAALIFGCDLAKAALSVIISSLILTRSMGGAIAGLFVILGHMFPIYYKFKGGKGVACAAMVVLLLSPWSFVILIPVFILIVVTTRFVSLASIISVMLLPVLHYAFYPLEGWISLSSIIIMILIVYMHRGNIKKLREGKESKISFKKTDKHSVQGGSASAEQGAKDATEQSGQAEIAAPAAPEREYSDRDFVRCACGRLIPRTREICVYCNVKNPYYVPRASEPNEKKRRKK